MAPTDRGPALGERREREREEERRGEERGEGEKARGERTRGGGEKEREERSRRTAEGEYKRKSTGKSLQASARCFLEYVQVCCFSAVFPQSQGYSL